MEKILLKPAEAAEVLAIGRTRIYEMLAAGQLPSIRIGRSIRVPVDALRQWVELQRTGTDATQGEVVCRTKEDKGPAVTEVPPSLSDILDPIPIRRQWRNRMKLEAVQRKPGRPRAIPEHLIPKVLLFYRQGLGYRAVARELKHEGISVDWSTIRRVIKAHTESGCRQE